MYQPPTEIMRRAGMYLRVTMPDAKAKLKEHLRVIEAVRYELAETRADWGKMLAEKKSQYLHPKDKEFTEMDRKIMLNAQLADIERDYEFLCTIELLVKERIDLGKVLLTVG